VYAFRGRPEAGGLMSFASNYTDLYRRAAGYVAKILRGTKLGDLPIEQPTKVELVINMKTAKALGLTILQSLLMRGNPVAAKSALGKFTRAARRTALGQPELHGG